MVQCVQVRGRRLSEAGRRGSWALNDAELGPSSLTAHNFSLRAFHSLATSYILKSPLSRKHISLLATASYSRCASPSNCLLHDPSSLSSLLSQASDQPQQVLPSSSLGFPDPTTSPLSSPLRVSPAPPYAKEAAKRRRCRPRRKSSRRRSCWVVPATA